MENLGVALDHWHTAICEILRQQVPEDLMVIHVPHSAAAIFGGVAVGVHLHLLVDLITRSRN
eukprot:1949132-Rhodomonas_salina.2